MMHTMHTRERNFIFSFIYKGFRAFSGLFLYASPDAYKCIHAYKTGRGTLRYCKVPRPSDAIASPRHPRRRHFDRPRPEDPVRERRGGIAVTVGIGHGLISKRMFSISSPLRLATQYSVPSGSLFRLASPQSTLSKKVVTTIVRGSYKFQANLTEVRRDFSQRSRHFQYTPVA